MRRRAFGSRRGVRGEYGVVERLTAASRSLSCCLLRLLLMTTTRMGGCRTSSLRVCKVCRHLLD